MEATKKQLKVYCETSFVSWLVSRPSTNPDHAVKQAYTLLATHAVPEKETADAFHIATAAVYGMDILLTWNCKHMANLITLPKTASVIAANGYECPKILTPKDALEVEYD